MTLPLDLTGLDTGTVNSLFPARQQLVITVLGKPITQGSKTKSKWGMYDDNAVTLKPWREAVKTAALEVMHGRERILTPVEARLQFYFERPAAHYGTGRNAGVLKDSAPAYPDNVKSGDLDKLQRSCFDSLTDAGVWKDDSLVVRVYAEKLWTRRPGAPADSALTIAGARIWVRQVTP